MRPFTAVASVDNLEFETSHMSLGDKALEKNTCKQVSSRAVPLPTGQVPNSLARPQECWEAELCLSLHPHLSPSHFHIPCPPGSHGKMRRPLHEPLSPGMPFILCLACLLVLWSLPALL